VTSRETADGDIRASGAWLRTEGVFVAALVGAVIGAGVSMAVPLAIKPKPKVIPEHITEESLECYLNGHALSARRRRVRGALAECVVGGFVFIYPYALFGLD